MFGKILSKVGLAIKDDKAEEIAKRFRQKVEEWASKDYNRGDAHWDEIIKICKDFKREAHQHYETYLFQDYMAVEQLRYYQWQTDTQSS